MQPKNNSFKGAAGPYSLMKHFAEDHYGTPAEDENLAAEGIASGSYYQGGGHY